MLKRFCNRPVLLVMLGLGLGLLVGVGMMIGTWSTLAFRPADSLTLPETLLHATASHSGENMALATGQVDEDAEGLFVLDYLTGDLQCYVLYPRLRPRPAIGGVFKYNVLQDLGVQQGKNPSYVMVTGNANFQVPGTSMCAVYVADANTGNFAIYMLPWNRTPARTGAPQNGPFVLLDAGKARQIEIREP